jgi:hypothetical protein
MEVNSRNKEDDQIHIVHKVPSGDGPYVKAKHAQVDSIFLFMCFLKNCV